MSTTIQCLFNCQQMVDNGRYWDINSAGIFKQKYSRRKPEVYTRPALKPETDTDFSGVNSSQTKGVTAPAGNSPQTSVGKDKTSSANKQENERNFLIMTLLMKQKKNGKSLNVGCESGRSDFA